MFSLVTDFYSFYGVEKPFILPIFFQNFEKQLKTKTS